MQLRFDYEHSDFKRYKLGELVENVVAGATPKTSIEEYWNGGDIPWLSSGEVHKKYIYFTDKFITSEGYNNSSTKLIPKDSVLIALAGQGKTRGTVAINKIELCTNQSIASIIPNNNLYYKFLFYYLESKYDYLRALSSSDGGRGGLNLKLIRSIPIKIPSINEQKNISNFINSIDKKITLLERKLNSYQDFKKYLMQQIFAQKLRFNEFDDEWKTVKLSNVAEIVGGGTPNTEVEEYWNGGIKWFTPSEIGKTKYISESDRYISEEGLKNSSAKLLPKNTILLSSRATVGEISIALTECSTNQGFQSLITKNTVDNEFIYYLISTLKNEFLRRSSGSTFLEISKNEIKKIKINIPSLSEQKRISSLFSSIDNKIDLLKIEHEKCLCFKKSLLQQMFNNVRLVLNLIINEHIYHL